MQMAEVYLGFYSLKQLGVLLPTPGKVASPLWATPNNFRWYPYAHLGPVVRRRSKPTPGLKVKLQNVTKIIA